MTTTTNATEPWLRGPIPGTPAPLQPLAFAFIAAREDIVRAVAGLSAEEMWSQPGGIASIGFQLSHLAGSTDRLLTYARGGSLSASQREALARERAAVETRPPGDELVASLGEAIDHGLSELQATDPSTLTEPRLVGRAQSPSTVLGLLFHAAEHAARHAGQIVTTAKLLRGSRTPPS